MVDLRSNPMLLEPLHKWLSNLFYGIMVLFGCSDEGEVHVTASGLYLCSGFGCYFIIYSAHYTKYSIKIGVGVNV
jgi:hypothetical protein